MNNPTLRLCPRCGGAWPIDADHALRSFSFLRDLPRGVTPSNLDGTIVSIHDDTHGPDAFLILEAKPLSDWPLQTGQVRLLQAFARQPNFFVHILSGTSDQFVLRTVEADGKILGPKPTTGTYYREAVVRWLNGLRRRDAA